jgi:alpha-aminoadipate/glutamate carrier protein LysW
MPSPAARMSPEQRVHVAGLFVCSLHARTEERKREMSAECPECGAEIEAKDVMVGEIIVCPDCGVELEVTSLKPFAVQLAPEEDEDWGE